MPTKLHSITANRTLQIPYLSALLQRIQAIKLGQFFSKIYQNLSILRRKIPSISIQAQPNSLRGEPSKPMKKWIRPAILLFALILLLVGGRTLLASTKSTNNSSSKVTIAPPKQTIDLDREFTFPIRGVDNEEVGRVIKYSIKKMEIADEIIVKGQRATAVAGRTFLLLTIKLTNNEDVGIEIDSRDYIRLTLDGSEESLAADIHNDPVEVQPLSTKFTRIGFPVDDSIKSIQMSVGEIKGDKDLIQVDL